MATRNYRQAKRSREDARKKRQQEKMLKKQARGTADAPAPDAEPEVVAPADKIAT